MDKKRNDKKLILLTCVGLIVICSLIFVLLLLSTPSRNTNPPTSAPVEVPDNVIDIGAEIKKNFMFAVVTDEGTIEVRNNLNERVIINLEKKNWQDIKWSPDNKYISVLGESASGVFDIYLYNVADKNWQMFTNYSSTGLGVTSYEWVTNSFIYFTQGNEPDRWIHRLGIPSMEILKLNRVSGVISKVSNDFNNLLEKVDNSFRILDLNGNVVYSLNNIEELQEDGSSQNINVTDLFFTDNSEKLIIQSNSIYYKAEFGSTRAIKLKEIVFNLTCTVEEDEALGYIQTDRQLELILVDTKEDEVVEVVGKTFDSDFELMPSLFECYIGKNILIKAKINNADVWYTIENDEIVEAPFLSGANTVSAKQFDL